jgi:hypothetical protein
VDQTKCRDCGEILFKSIFAKPQDEQLSLCTKSREHFQRLEATGHAQPRVRPSCNPDMNYTDSTSESEPTTTRSTPQPTSSRPLPSRLSSEVIRALSDTDVQMIIENERNAIRQEEQTRLAKEIIDNSGLAVQSAIILKDAAELVKKALG